MLKCYREPKFIGSTTAGRPLNAAIKRDAELSARSDRSPPDCWFWSHIQTQVYDSSLSLFDSLKVFTKIWNRKHFSLFHMFGSQWRTVEIVRLFLHLLSEKQCSRLISNKWNLENLKLVKEKVKETNYKPVVRNKLKSNVKYLERKSWEIIIIIKRVCLKNENRINLYKPTYV